jgi:hypothetical protein
VLKATGKLLEVSVMELIQIGSTQPKTATSIREMFAMMAQREAEMVRAARERMMMGSSSAMQRGNGR